MKTLAEHQQQVPSKAARRWDVMILPWLACLVVAVVVHFAAPMLVNEYWQNVLRRVGVFMIAAVSLNIVNGYAGQFSMGHAGFMAVGAYVAGATTYYGSLLLHGSVNDAGFYTQGILLMLTGIGLGCIIAAIAGYLVGLPSLRLRGDYLAIVTLGFGEIIRVMLELTKGQLDSAEAIKDAGAKALIHLNGPSGFFGIPSYANLFWIFLFVSVTCLVAYRIKYSSTGRALLSIREDEIAARSMGVDLTKYKVRAFVLAAALGGLAGGLYSHIGANPSPTDAGFQRSFDIILLVVLGGLGSISGSVLAGLVLIMLPEVLREAQQYRLIIFALLLIIMMIVRPKGLFGVKEIWELRGARKAARKSGEKAGAL